MEPHNHAGTSVLQGESDIASQRALTSIEHVCMHMLAHTHTRSTKELPGAESMFKCGRKQIKQRVGKNEREREKRKDATEGYILIRTEVLSY